VWQKRKRTNGTPKPCVAGPYDDGWGHICAVTKVTSYCDICHANYKRSASVPGRIVGGTPVAAPNTHSLNRLREPMPWTKSRGTAWCLLPADPASGHLTTDPVIVHADFHTRQRRLPTTRAFFTNRCALGLDHNLLMLRPFGQQSSLEKPNVFQARKCRSFCLRWPSLSEPAHLPDLQMHAEERVGGLTLDTPNSASQETSRGFTS